MFVHYENVSEESATVCVKSHLSFKERGSKAVKLRSWLRNTDGVAVTEASTLTTEVAGGESTVEQELLVSKPLLWHVDAPNLYDLIVEIRNEKSDEIVDAVCLRIGIRSIEFRGREGFFLNDSPFDGKLIGSNRHQDYAYVGNALHNHVHWRDAVKHRQAGMRVIRCAHYPQDPSFMDACDALGMFVIITTPGWQFWSDVPEFEQRVYSDIRNMVRRDRNRPSALLWEPILNETSYPDYFAQRVHELTHQEYPYPGCYTACDQGAAGQEHFDVVYSHLFSCVDVWEKTEENEKEHRYDFSSEERSTFTREWGDCPADWRAQSSPSRVHKGWGEQAQLIQADHYANPNHVFGSNYETLSGAGPQHVGGTLWHGIDHQRGYHADAFWGGFLDATRQPKFSYDMFRSQVPPDIDVPLIESGPFVSIAHLVHPTSGPDVTVFSNCDEVRLKVDGETVGCMSTRPEGAHMPHRPLVFENAFRFYRHGKESQSFEAEGLINGKVVATHVRRAWDRRHELTLEVDMSSIPLVADGGDFVPVIARIRDKRGEVVRLTDDTIRFSIEGPGEIIGDNMEAINPQKLCWGEAVVLVRARHEAGTIIVRAESQHSGACKALKGEIRIESTPASELNFTEVPLTGKAQASQGEVSLSEDELRKKVAELTAEVNELKVAQVEKQQEDWM